MPPRSAWRPGRGPHARARATGRPPPSLRRAAPPLRRPAPRARCAPPGAPCRVPAACGRQFPPARSAPRADRPLLDTPEAAGAEPTPLRWAPVARGRRHLRASRCAGRAPRGSRALRPVDAPTRGQPRCRGGARRCGREPCRRRRQTAVRPPLRCRPARPTPRRGAPAPRPRDPDPRRRRDSRPRHTATTLACGRALRRRAAPAPRPRSLAASSSHGERRPSVASAPRSS